MFENILTGLCSAPGDGTYGLNFFEILTLIPDNKIGKFPIVLVGKPILARVG